ncbi:MAG TPA: acyl-CoA dehydratase activase [archaeon]|nr:acyl-CoA dehydratase activase [archaeon]
MAIHIGVDLGSISVKAALFSIDPADTSFFQNNADNPVFQVVKHLKHPATGRVCWLAVTRYQRIAGNPMKQTKALLDQLIGLIEPSSEGHLAATGSGVLLLKKMLGLSPQNEFRALAKASELLQPGVRTLFEMGGENSKLLLFERDEASGKIGIADYQTNGDCAAGTGAFLDQQASRLRFKVEEIGDIVTATERAPMIAGRCSVFAKSDMIHAQQRGFNPEEILKGLCIAVARNFKSAITKGKQAVPQVAFVGGVAANRGVAAALESVFGWEPGALIIPEEHAAFAAVGAAILSCEGAAFGSAQAHSVSLHSAVSSEVHFPHSNPLSCENVVLLRDRMVALAPDEIIDRRDAYLGIDIGSVSTNLVVIDNEFNVLKEIYLSTEARPIQAVNRGLQEIERDLGEKIRIRGVGTTGSGRELIGELVGADTVNDEITAHKTGATFIGRNVVDLEVDTIFEIGGQDSKFISLDQGVVVDFAMNEACAAGTGSFLEERAGELGIKIKDEFAEIAFSSKHPIRLGERCTVFMERDVNSYIQRGAELPDLVAGLAYSIATNYINRVVRGRKIGEVIFFQGGTAYNDAVAAAFSLILGKQIIVPPFNGVIGALGEAILAREKMLNNRQTTSFRGFDLEKIDYRIHEFTCKGCTNYCQIQEFTVEGERSYWGDKCSERYRKAVKCNREPVIENLIEFRRKLLLQNYDPDSGRGPVVGLPFSMWFYDWAPFWLRLFKELEIKVLVSEPTTNHIVNLGLESVVSEPCFPLQVAHGHLRWLIDKQVDYLFLPNLISSPGSKSERPSFYCPWNMTLPFVAAAAPFISDYEERIIRPTIWFNHGTRDVVDSICVSIKKAGIRKKTRQVAQAVERAFAEQNSFHKSLLEAGARALAVISSHNEHGIILLGRPYNIYDRGINLDVATKLRKYYGVNVIGLDFLNLQGYDISRIHDNMFWNYGQKVLQAAIFVKNKPRLHIIYITNFKCGPDSYIKHFIAEASGKPFLSLQFDGHNNDAGIITRCEAYLDSKGVLRRWGSTEQEMAAETTNF